MGLFSLIVSENGLEYIDKFGLFINYRPNWTKSIKQILTLIGIMEFENIAIDNDSQLIVFFRLCLLVGMTTHNLIFHKISCVCISEWSFINQSYYWRPFPPCCTAPCLAKEANGTPSYFTSITPHFKMLPSRSFLNVHLLPFTLALDAEWVVSPV